MPYWATTIKRIPGGNRGSKITVQGMHGLAARGGIDPIVISAAQNALRTVPERDDDATFRALLGDVRRRMRYTHDPLDGEVVKDPAYVVQRTEEGVAEPMDCDDASVLLASYLRAVGYPTRFVTVATDRSRPGEWTHVYVEAQRRDGRWTPMDPIVRNFGVGDAVPKKDLTAPPARHGGPPMNCSCNRTRALLGYSPGLGSNNFFQDLLQSATSTLGKKYDASVAKSQAQAAQAAARAQAQVMRANKQSAGFFQKVDESGQIVTDPIKVGLVIAAGAAAVFMLKKRR